MVESAPRFTFSRAVVPLISLGLLFIFWRQGQKWVTAPVIVFIAFYYFIIPRLVRSREGKFQKEAIGLLTTGKADEVPKLVRRNIFLQLFGTRSIFDAKLGLAYAECSDFARAIPCFEHSIPSASYEERPALRAGMIKALFVTGDLARAEAEGRSLLEQGLRLPEILAIVARCRVGLGKIDDKTMGLLDEASRLSPRADVELMIELTRIEAALLTGRKSGDISFDADSSQRFLRAWIHLVRGLLREHRGDAAKAEESFSRAVELLDNSFISAVTRKHLARRADGTDQKLAGAPGHDPAVRRKKKKRR